MLLRYLDSTDSLCAQQLEPAPNPRAVPPCWRLSPSPGLQLFPAPHDWATTYPIGICGHQQTGAAGGQCGQRGCGFTAFLPRKPQRAAQCCIAPMCAEHCVGGAAPLGAWELLLCSSTPRGNKQLCGVPEQGSAGGTSSRVLLSTALGCAGAAARGRAFPPALQMRQTAQVLPQSLITSSSN